LPSNTNIFITGPRKSGKKTIAALLSSIYGLKIINIQELLENVMMKQRQFETHIPSNFDRRSSSIHLSEGEFK
jgi:shikimate kinase